MKFLKWLLPLAALLVVMGADTLMAQNSSCPAVTIPPVSANRGQIHTQILDVTTGKRRTIFSLRTHADSGGNYMIFGTSAQCPQQGCSLDSPRSQDCFVSTAPNPQQSFDWDIATAGMFQPTTSVKVSLKQPSGTIVLSQDVNSAAGKVLSPPQCSTVKIPSPGVDALHTEVVDTTTGLSLGIVSVEIYGAKHPGSTDVDFFAVIGVNPTVTFSPEPPAPSDCTTVTTNKTGWYDSYWALAAPGTNNTKSESLAIGSQGQIVLSQSY